ncbi:hypothetical protein ABR737_01015 [Streptomyces sp. Edi2]|uniref:hypothetical protein n=1 Tax=Streptomyces sp. Edi2 TaxID=3162528 RepID=UPI0033062ED6
MKKKKSAHTTRIDGLHKDGTTCPMTGPHQGTGRNSGRACHAHGGRRLRVACTCGADIPATDRLDAIVTKAVHQALHIRGELTFRYTVDDGDGEGPKRIREVQTLTA